MIKHIVFFQFKDPACIPEVSERLLSLPAQIPEICSMEFGTDFLRSPRSFDCALIVTFRSREDMEVYDKHPAHQVVRSFIHARRTDSGSVDFFC